jgi:Leucine-rich repeat (LRR) protein
MLRGTDMDSIPDRIQELTELTTLRFENCALTTLPLEISKLKKLKSLGLSDTKLTNIGPESLPKSLKKINLTGTTLYNLDIKLKR